MAKQKDGKRELFATANEPPEVSAIYGDDELETSGATVQIATPISILTLRADPAQPRRTVPLSIRQGWDGGAAAVPALLRRWRSEAEKECGREIPIIPLVRGLDDEVDGFDVDPKTEPITDKFIQLIGLASGIRREGLLNPIQVNRTMTGGMIVAGERRWLAHHVLHQFDDDVNKWISIPAMTTEPNVWKQAQENGNRSPLNAIEMARQLALLIMDMYEDEVEFQPYDQIVSRAGSDRAYYAQVADGQQFRIKRGFGDKILEATGLKSRYQIGQYRDLLNLDDKNWRMADEHNWTEGRCRRILHPESQKPKDMLTTVNVSPEADNKTPAGFAKSWRDEDSPIQPSAERVEATKEELSEYQKWQIEREEELARARGDMPPHVEEAIADIAEVDMMGYGVTDRGKAENPIEFEDGRRGYNPIEDKDAIPQVRGNYDKPPAERDYQRREMPERPELKQKRMPQTDEADRVALVVYHNTLQRLLNNLKTMAMNMDMQVEYNLLGRINMWAPESIETIMEKHGREGVIAQIEEVEGAISRIFEAFNEKWQGLMLDVGDVVKRFEEASSDS